MGKDCDIEYCDSSINLQMGCNGCELWNPSRKSCYAGILTQRYAGKNPGFPASFEQPRLYVERLDTALAWSDLRGKPRRHKPWLDELPRVIFLNDMGDTWTEGLPRDWLAPLLPRIAASPHFWLILTKRPKLAAEFSRTFPFPPNVMIIASVTSRATERRLDYLREVDCHWRGVSAEPLLGPISLRPWLYGPGPRLDWVITGGESGKAPRWSHPAWFEALHVECVEANVPHFHKQNGDWCQTSDLPEDADIGKVSGFARIDLAGCDVSDLPGLWGEEDVCLRRVPKRLSGRLLNGRTCDGMPNITGDPRSEDRDG